MFSQFIYVKLIFILFFNVLDVPNCFVVPVYSYLLSRKTKQKTNKTNRGLNARGVWTIVTPLLTMLLSASEEGNIFRSWRWTVQHMWWLDRATGAERCRFPRKHKTQGGGGRCRFCRSDTWKADTPLECLPAGSTPPAPTAAPTNSVFPSCVCWLSLHLHMCGGPCCPPLPNCGRGARLCPVCPWW